MTKRRHKPLLVAALLVLAGNRGWAQEPAEPAAVVLPVADPPPPTATVPLTTISGLDPGAPADLASLDALTQGGDEPEERSKLQIYGFGDTNFYLPLVSENNPWLQFFPRHSAFVEGTLNLYLASPLGSRARTMAEVRFLFSPQGSSVIQEGGAVTITDDEIQDPSEFGHTIRWGGISIQRAWVEYDVLSGLTVRAGHFLTPYGIWNVDHGSPSIVGIKRPWVIREQLFPEAQTGIEVHGRKTFAAYSLQYHLTLSNGRGPMEATADGDNNKAIGGRLEIERRGAAEVTVGGSFYRGRYTYPKDHWSPTIAGQPWPYLIPGVASQYDEMSVAADFRLTHQGLLLQSEFVLNDRGYNEPGRPVVSPTGDRLTPDARRWGIYGLLGHRFHFLGVMPYGNVEYYNFDSAVYPLTTGKVPHVLSYFLGLNFRPQGDLIFKVEGFLGTFPGSGPGWGRSNISGLQLQAAWVF